MHPYIYRISFWVGLATDGVLLTYSLVFCFRTYNPGYMKTLALYAFVNIISDVLVRLGVDQDIVYFFFSLLELFYFSFLLCIFTLSRTTRRIVMAANALSFLYLILLVCREGFKDVDRLVVVFECSILILGYFNYLRELHMRQPGGGLSIDPSFWIAIGVLIYFMMQVPILIFSPMVEVRKMYAIKEIMYATNNNYGQIITYRYFVKSMLCLKKRSSYTLSTL